MTIQEEFQYFIEQCTKAPGSYRNYNGGLVSFVDERLKELVPDYKGIYNYASSETVSHFIDMLRADKTFCERDDSSKANKMYSNSLVSYWQFLKARDFFKYAKGESLPAIGKSLQQIYYGAPGTGKSHVIKELTRGKRVIRTTFHPDSDYSTFVGAYKPTTKEVIMRDLSGHVVIEDGLPVKEEKIVYEFVEQAFLKAYTNAWKMYAEAGEDEKAEEEYLVIEEINRGNCAQIFGDLFQLLDRNDSGFSDYPIVADNDMKKQLAKAFEGLDVPQRKRIDGLYDEPDMVKRVLEGEVLLLPDNLFIWATMNTSDQSLFPIDSAFKRRWDWRYMPIKDAGKNWRIAVKDGEYDWWQFLEKVNEQVGSMTNSEDKKLGYFFCKPKDGKIDAETFVGKVCFYLWNDVFKDYGLEGDLFRTADGKNLTFDRLYGQDNKVDEENVATFLEKLGVERIEMGEEEDEEEEEDIQKRTRQITTYLSVTFNGISIEGSTGKDTFVKTINKIIELDGSSESLINLGIQLGDYYVFSRELIVGNDQKSIGARSQQVLSDSGDCYILTKISTGGKARIINEVAQRLKIEGLKAEEKPIQ